MLTGRLPEWPFSWPPVGLDRLRGRVHSDLIAIIRKSIEVDPRKRFASGVSLLTTFRRIKPRALTKGINKKTLKNPTGSKSHWKSVQWRQFQRLYGKQLYTNCKCGRCGGPVAETMAWCPWCSTKRTKHDAETGFSICCPRCHRGLKTDWLYCPWCYGPGFEVGTTRKYSDKRYVARCTNTKCSRKQLMAFMRYCPWCRRKVNRKWKIEGSNDVCKACGWGTVGDFWKCCPWCGKTTGK